MDSGPKVQSRSSRSAVLPLEDLLERVLAYQPTADVDLLRRAYDFAYLAHEGQVRKSGEPYFSHPAAVAGVITELRLDVACVCAGLLHDVVEDTPQTIADLARLFGREVAFLVDGVTKMSSIRFSSRHDREAENFRKLLDATSRDIRVLLVKLCDRVHNMRTLEFMKTDSQERIARETTDFFAPLAGRLGIDRFRIELEDLSFRFLEPEACLNLERLMTESRPVRDRMCRVTCELLRTQMREHGFDGEVRSIERNLHSIYRQMVRQNMDLERLRYLVNFRIIVETQADCYGALGAVHAKFTPVPGSIKDHIAMPKPNMYQSLHTSVIGPSRERIDVQVRTKEMDRVADEGIAANWVYRDSTSGHADPKFIQRFVWLRELLESQRDVRDAAEFLNSIKQDLFQNEIYAITPKGELRGFPQGATAIDFAYAIHTEIGDHSSGTRVNGAIAPLRYKLRNGDIVEMLTNSNQCPKKEWLDFATTSRARNRIRAYLRNSEREQSIKLGREMLDKELHDHEISLQRLVNDDRELRGLLAGLELSTLHDMYMAIAYGRVSVGSVTQALSKSSGNETTKPPANVREGAIEHFVRRITKRDGSGLKVSEFDETLVHYAGCCNPLPGDEIVGVISRGSGITVHRRDCAEAFETDPARVVPVAWDSRTKSNRIVQLKVLTVDKPGILGLMGRAFSDQGVNISTASSRATDDGRSVNFFSFACSDLAHLKVVMRALRKVEGVFSVERA